MRSTAARFALPAAVAIVVLVAVVASAAPPALAQEDAGGQTTFGVDLRPDGDARFTVTLRLQLETEEQVEAYDQLEDDHVSGSTSPLSVRPFERAATGATEVTGRPMEIRDVSRTANRQNRTGRLSLSFTWTNFSRVSEDRLVVGDAFQTPTGTWLPRLDADQELVVSFPPGYEVQSVSRPVENGSIHVEGPASFEPGQPSAVLTGSPDGPLSGLIPLIAGGAVLLVALALLVFFFRYREGSRDVAGEGGEDAAVGNGGEAVAEPTGDSVVTDDPLLSDEERIIRLLESEGGRMKQVDIVQETDWSNAKVSQLLSEMAEDGKVDKLRIGRENLISLPGQGPGSAGDASRSG